MSGRAVFCFCDMMIKRMCFVALWMCIACCCHIVAAGITYTKADSLKVVRLLEEGARQGQKVNLMLYYGKKMQGIPYVAHTLEVNKTEKLVVNMRQMDCTTFVETVFALALTTKEGSRRWEDFCRWLERIRYQQGRVDGYPSRNHYFLWWAENNEKQGLVTLPLQKEKCEYARKQVIDIDYMTVHPQCYSMLKGNKADIAAIARMEKASKGKVMKYIPAENMGLTQARLKWIKTGDILAIATKKKGLDTTHIGIAVWGEDGRLHLLNASQIHKKVILEPKNMRQYMKEHPSQLGVWVIHPLLLND